jgi:MFS family permease
MTASSPPVASPTAPPIVAPAEAPRSRSVLRTFRALSNRDFRFLWVGTMGGFGAMTMQQVAFGYLAYVLTGSAVMLGLVSLATGSAQTICSLFSGAVVDRLPKRRLLITTQTTLGTIAAINFLLVLAGVIQVWQLLLVALCQGAVFAFNMPTRQAYMVHLSRSPNETHNAIALHTAGMNLMRVIGPAIAGGILSIPVVGVRAIFFGIAACYGWSLFSISQIKNKAEVGERKKSSVLGDLAEGWKYIGRSPVLLSLLVLSFATTMLSAPFQVLMPVFALKEFGVGSGGLGLLLAAVGIGALVGSLLTAYLSDSNRKGRIQFVVGLANGLLIAAFALSPSLLTALPALFLAGACGSMLMSINNSLITTNSSREMYGRVMGAYMISFALFPLGVLPMSALADTVGARPALAGGGVLLTLVVLGLFTFSPALRKLR